MQFKKTSFIIFFILLIFQSFSQKKKNDSTILFKEFLSDSAYHVVFIDYKKNSPYYRKLSNIITDKELSTQQILNIADSSSIHLDREFNSWLLQTWYPLKKYKRNYYLYSPSDLGESPCLKLSDSLIYEFQFDEGLIKSIITNFRVESKCIKLKYSNLIQRENELNIYIIDRDREIVVFERPNLPLQYKYSLMISERKMRLFPIIVNYCLDDRTNEWNFDKIDYYSILKMHKLN